ncbi:MAG: hypothetical protein ACI8PW_000211 [Methylophilaceae bacterium]|jgi:hypothetical protein
MIYSDLNKIKQEAFSKGWLKKWSLHQPVCRYDASDAVSIEKARNDVGDVANNKTNQPIKIDNKAKNTWHFYC